MKWGWRQTFGAAQVASCSWGQADVEAESRSWVGISVGLPGRAVLGLDSSG